MGETVISEVLIRNNRLLRTLKDIGTFYQEWTHTFPSKTLNPEQREQLMGLFQDYNSKAFDRIMQFNIMQIQGPTNLPDLLEGEQAAEFKKHFVTGHYIPQARWRTQTPWTVAEADERLIQVLKEKQKAECELNVAMNYAAEELMRLPKRRIKNFEEYVQKNWEKLPTIISKGPLEVAERTRQSLETKVNELLGEGTVETNPKDRSYDIILKNNYIKPVRSITADEILNSRLYIIDIEKPLFNTPEEEVSWVATILLDKGKPVKKTIRTLRNPGTNRLNDWDIELYKSESEMVDAIRTEITTPMNGKTVDAIAAYNAPYDIEHTEEAGDFEIGERESDPKVEVAVDFFRKLKVHGKLVLDPLRQARVRFRHLPNRKFELVLAEAQNILSSKLVNYEQLALLERSSKYGDTSILTQHLNALVTKEAGTITPENCALTAAKYVAGDVDHLQQMLQSKWYKDHLTDCVKISEDYHVELSRIMHSVKTINDAQERCYFDFVGTYRDVVYKKFKKMIRLQQEGRSYLMDRLAYHLCQQSRAGAHKNVYKVALPVGMWLADHVAGINPNNNQQRFTDVLKLRDYALQFKHDKPRYGAINQYLDSLADYLMIDFGLLEKARSEFQTKLAEAGIEYRAFEEAYREIKTGLNPLPQYLGKIPPQEFWQQYRLFKAKLQKESEWGPVHLRKGTLTAKGVLKHADEQLRAFWNKYNINAEQFTEMLRAAREEHQAIHSARELPETTLETHLGPKARKLMADFETSTSTMNELVHLRSRIEKRERKMFGQYNVKAFAVKKTLLDRISEVHKFANNNGYRIIHAQAGFIYLQGTDPEPLSSPDAPVILADTIPAAYIAINPSDPRERKFSQELKHKIFYPKHNYYEGIKVTDRPSNLMTMLEMRCYAPLVELVMKQDFEGALNHANSALDELRNILKSKEDDAKGWENIVGKEMTDRENYDPFLTIRKEDLVWHSKKNDRYKAYENGQLIHFVTDEKRATGEIQEEKRRYFEEPVRKGSENTRKVYIMQINDLHPDIGMMYKRMQDRVRDFIEPIVGHWDAAKFVKKPQKKVSSYIKMNDIFELFQKDQRV